MEAFLDIWNVPLNLAGFSEFTQKLMYARYLQIPRFDTWFWIWLPSTILDNISFCNIFGFSVKRNITTQVTGPSVHILFVAFSFFLVFYLIFNFTLLYYLIYSQRKSYFYIVGFKISVFFVYTLSFLTFLHF